MKKRLYFSLLFVALLSCPLSAQVTQSWPKANAVWKYCVQGDYPNFDVWLLTYAYTADTLIGAHSYAMVQHTEVDGQPLAADGSSWWIPEENMRSYFRQSGDTIYRHVNDHDYVFMVLGLEVNQGFSSFRSMYDDWDQWNCNDELPLQVLSFAEPQYAGVTYRELSLQDIDPYFINVSSNGNFYTFIEGIGLKDHFVYLTPEHADIGGDLNENGDLADCLGSVLHLPVSTLCHYHDDNVSIDSFLGGVGVSTVNALQGRGLSVFPNPSSGHFALGLADGNLAVLDVQVFDLSGKLLSHIPQVPSGQSISTHTLHPGLYVVHATDGNHSFVGKLVVR